ncbi:unnamed protein product [Penicillium manginii]
MHAQAIQTLDDFTPIDGGPRRGYSILGGLLGGPMLHFVPTTSPGRPSKSSSMEIWRALLCNRSFPRDDGAHAFPHATHPGIGWTRPRPIGFLSPARLNGTSAVYRNVYFLPM